MNEVTEYLKELVAELRTLALANQKTIEAQNRTIELQEELIKSLKNK